MSVSDLLRMLFEEYDYPAYTAALPAGGQRLANVEMLLVKAADFEKNSYHGLFHFVRYIEQLQKYYEYPQEQGTGISGGFCGGAFQEV